MSTVRWNRVYRWGLFATVLAWFAACGAAESGGGAAGAATGAAQPAMTGAGQAGVATAPARAGSGSAGRAASSVAGAAGSVMNRNQAVAASAGASGSAADGGGGAPAASAGSSGAAGTATSAAGVMASAMTSVKLPPVDNTQGRGSFETMQDLSNGPKGQSGLFWPTPLGENALLHPIFVFGCGGTTTPSTYADQLSQIASHGFVVIGEVEEIGDDGAPMVAALDWMIAQNDKQDSPFHGKLDTTKVALGGHSIGSANGFLAAKDPRWTTSIHVAGGSLDDVNDPSAPTTGMGGKALMHPAAFILGDTDIFGNIEKTDKDYDATSAPVFYTIIAGVDHIAAFRAGLPVTIAWLRWQLGAEEERRSSFLDPKGEFSTGTYKSRSKNW